MKPPGTSTNYYKTNQSSMSTINNPSTENCWSEAPVPSSSRVHREPFAPMIMNGNDTYPRYANKKNESTSYHGFSDETYFTPLEVHSNSNHDGSIERELLDNAWNDDYTDHNDHMDNYYHNTMKRSPAQNGEFSPLPMIQEQFYGNEEGSYADENLPVYQELDNGKQQVVLENTPYQKDTNTANLVIYTDHMKNHYDVTTGTAPNGQFDCDPVQMYQHNYVGNDEEGYVEEGLPVYQELGNGKQQVVLENTPYQEATNTASLVRYADHMVNNYHDTMGTAPNGQFDYEPVQMYQHNYVGNDEEGYVGEGLTVYQELDNGEQQEVFENTQYQETDNTVNSVMPSNYHPTTVSSTIAPTQNYSKQQLDDLLNAELGEDETIDTIDLCASIKRELNNQVIPQHVFAKRILGRTQGTLSDLLKHPKPFNSLKTCGKLTFRRMHNWMLQPSEMRLAILDMKGNEESEESSESSHTTQHDLPTTVSSAIAPTKNDSKQQLEDLLNAELGKDETINTIDLCETIKLELEEQSIPRDIFAKRILNRKKGALYDMLRNPKPWTALNSTGRLTHLRMHNWMMQPLEKRLAIFDLKGEDKSEESPESSQSCLTQNVQCQKEPTLEEPAPKRSRKKSTGIQKDTLQSSFEEEQRPNTEMKQTTSNHQDLDSSQTHTFEEQTEAYENTPYQEATNTANMVRYTDDMDNIDDNTTGTVPNGQFDCDPVQMIQHNYVGNAEEGYVEEGLPVYQELSNGGQQDEFHNFPYQEDDNTVNSVMPSTYLPTTVSSTIARTQNFSKRQLEDLLNARLGKDESIDTIDLCENIKIELKERFIPRDIFAKRILNRKQGALYDMLRHPNRWITLSSTVRLNYLRMHNWMKQPLETRLALLEVEIDEESESFQSCPTQRQRTPTLEEPAPKRPRKKFTVLQRSTLQSCFEEEQRPSSEVQREIANHLGLDFYQVQNFFLNSRRRFGRKEIDVKDPNDFEEEYEQ